MGERLSSWLHFWQVGSWRWDTGPRGWIPESSVYHTCTGQLSVLEVQPAAKLWISLSSAPLLNYSRPMEPNLALKSPSSPCWTHPSSQQISCTAATASCLSVPWLVNPLHGHKARTQAAQVLLNKGRDVTCHSPLMTESDFRPWGCPLELCVQVPTHLSCWIFHHSSCQPQV